MRNRNTIEFLGIWEQLFNPSFNPLEFEGFRMSQGQVIDIMTFNSYGLQYYSFWKGKIGFARTVPVSWTTPMSIASVTVDS